MTTIDNLRPKEEAVLLGVDGIADFNGLHSRKQDDDVQLYAFDVLMSAGDDLRPLPLHLRKNHLAKVLRRRVDGIGQAVLLLG
jgi:bifunctional non-homologous end joining protein LigD